MYKYHEQFNTPNKETVIWKYMDLFKFLDLISSKELFMLRTDLFMDKSDGVNRNTVEHYKELLPSVTPFVLENFGTYQMQINQKVRKGSFVNCWHINNHESSVMWDAYSNSNGGIAIKTTISKVIDSIIDERNIYISEVEYSNGPIPLDNAYYPLVIKKPQFKDERELRLFYVEPDVVDPNSNKSYPNSIRIKLNLENLFEEIYFHPLTELWVVESLKKIIKNVAKKVNPIRSSLYS